MRQDERPQRAILIIEPLVYPIRFHPVEQYAMPKVQKAFAALKVPVLVPARTDWSLPSYSDKWPLAHQTEKFSFVWSRQYIKHWVYPLLSKFHRVNHIPGIGSICQKLLLYKNYEGLRKKFGSKDFDFMPLHFRLPEDLSAFQEANERRSKEAPVRPEDPDFGKRWLTKDLANHRGIELISSQEIEGRVTNGKGVAVAENVEPLLLHGFKFDVGLYIAIASVNPLRFYVYDQVVDRACVKPYPTVLKDSSPLDSYVIADKYRRFYQIHQLKEAYQQDGIPSTNRLGTLHLTVLTDYLNSIGMDGEQVIQSMKDSITKILTGTRHLLELGADRMILEHPQRFVDLVRFDFGVDYKGNPYLLEMNISPNLQSTDPQLSGEATQGTSHFMKEAVVHDFVSLVSFAQEFEWKDEIRYDENVCQSKCQGEKNQPLTHDTMDCWKCPGWYNEEDRMKFAVSLAERAGAPSRFKPLYPPSDPDSPFPDYLLIESRVEKDLRWYLSNNGAFDVTCRRNDDCFGQGQCIERSCQCDSGYEGPFCFLPTIPSKVDWEFKTVTADSTLSWMGLLCRLLMFALILGLAGRSVLRSKSLNISSVMQHITRTKRSRKQH